MRLQIDSESKVPIYVQVEERIRALIAAGQLRPGEQLPTIRELAADLRVNYNTIARAYLELDHDGVISTQRGRGTFVAGVPDREQIDRNRHKKLHAVVRSALDEARMLGYEPREIAEAFDEELAAWREATSDEP
jgi:GntR family transcriptional regulator